MAHEAQQFKRAFEDEDQPVQPYRPEANQYPMVVAHPTKGKKVVNSADEHQALGDGWKHPGHEAPAEKKAAETHVVELSQEDDDRISSLEDRVTQLEAMVADLISKRKPAKGDKAE